MEHTLPMPEFTDTFRSFFDPKLESAIENAVVEFSPFQEEFQRFFKIYKYPNGKIIKTLNMKNLYEAIPRAYRQSSLLIPAKNVPEEIWKSVRLLRVDFNARKDQVTALAWSARTGNVTNLKRLLCNGAYTDRQLRNGNTVLMETIFAFTANRLECVRALLSAGARVDITNQAGHTAMTVAASVGDLAVIKLLLCRRHQLDLEHKTKMGHTALTMAATAGHIDTVRYLVEECDVDIIVEDDRCMTTVCWAHVKSPPVAAYLTVMLTVQDHADIFLKRRLEVIGQNPNDFDILSTFYAICLVFLQIRSARDLLVRNGSLTTLLKHPNWECVDYCCGDFGNEEKLGNLARDFSRIQPWIIALTCALAYNDTYIFEKFLQYDYERVFKYINNLARNSAVDEAARQLTQAALLPVISNEKGRTRLLEASEQYYPCLLKHLIDDEDMLSNEMFTIMAFFTENLEEIYGKYCLRAVKRNLDEVTSNSVFPKPIHSLSKRLLDAFACYEDFKRMIRQRYRDKQPVEEIKEVSEQNPATVVEVEKLSKRTRRFRKQLEEAKKENKPRSRETSESKSESNKLAANSCQLAQGCNNLSPKISNEGTVKVENVTPARETKQAEVKRCEENRQLSAAEEFQRLWVEDLTDKPPEVVCAAETSRVQKLAEFDAFDIKDMSAGVSGSSSASSLTGHQEDAPHLYRKTSAEEMSDVIVLSHRVEPVKYVPPASLFQPVRNDTRRNGAQSRSLRNIERGKKKDSQQTRNLDRHLNFKFQNHEEDLGNSPCASKDQAKKDSHKDKKESEKSKQNSSNNLQGALSEPAKVSNQGKDIIEITKPALSQMCSNGRATSEIILSENNRKNDIDACSEEDLYTANVVSETVSQNGEVKSPEESWNKNDNSKGFEKLPEKRDEYGFFIPSIHDGMFDSFCFTQNIVPCHPPNALFASHLEEQLLSGFEVTEEGKPDSNAAAGNTTTMTQVSEEWELANPICHTLQNLHRAASNESANVQIDPSELQFFFEDVESTPTSSVATSTVQTFTDSSFATPTRLTSHSTKAPPGFENVTTLMEIISWTPQSCRWKHLYEMMLSTPVSRFAVNGPLYFARQKEYCLSEGSTGKSTYLGINKDGVEIVIKCLDKQRGIAIVNAIKQMQQGDLLSANILKYKGFSEYESKIYLETGLCEYNLEEYLQGIAVSSRLEETSAELCRQLLNGLSALHDARILHMNLKPSNVLIGSAGCIRLADFGIPPQLQYSQEEKLCWKPKELLNVNPVRPYGMASDIQVAGMLLHYMMTGKHPYGDTYRTCEENIRANRPDLSCITNQIFANLMTWMLHPDVSWRKSAKTCLTHPFFWSAQKMFTFLKLVSQEPEMAIMCSDRDAVCEAIEQAQGWMDFNNNAMNPVVKKILLENGIPVESLEVKHILKAMVLAQDKFKSWPNGYFPMFMKSPDAVEMSQNPMVFFLSHYSRVFIGVYDIISHSPWRNRTALSLFFDQGHSMDVF